MKRKRFEKLMISLRPGMTMERDLNHRLAISGSLSVPSSNCATTLRDTRAS